MSIAEPLRPKPSTAYVAKQRHSHNLSQNVEPLSAWEPPPALQGQWARGAYGMKFYTTGMINYVVSWLLFIPLMPLFALLFLFCALLRLVPKSCSGPISYGVAVGWQYLAYVCVTFGCLRHTYFSLLVMRAKQLADFLFTTSLTLSYFPYSEAVGSMDYFYFNGLYVGSYDYVRSLILDAKRERSLSLGSVALSFPRSFSPLTPVFFSTGSPYHSAWRTVFFREFTRRADVQAMLADDAAGLAAVAAPYLREWLAVGDFHTREHVSACIFRLLARILFGIETVPQSLLAAAQAFGSGMGAFTAVAPAWAHSLLCGKLQASYGEPARYGLSSYLLEHCNAAKPAALKGRPFDWAAMAAECLGSGALADDEAHRPGSGGHAVAPLDPAHALMNDE